MPIMLLCLFSMTLAHLVCKPNHNNRNDNNNRHNPNHTLLYYILCKIKYNI